MRARALVGPHYLLYSFGPGLKVFNAFLQSLVGLRDFAVATGDASARTLFADGDREARAELPRADTGAWSRYSIGGAESDLGYHKLLRDVAATSATAPPRPRTARPPPASRATCATARG